MYIWYYVLMKRTGGIPSRKSGFTIVELLVVVVVIAILAAIVIVSYNGITGQARVAVAKADLRALAQQMELFKLDKGAYPDASTEPNYPEFETVVRAANLYKLTRRVEVGVPPERVYLFCSYVTEDKFTIVAVRPSPSGNEVDVGETVYFTNSDGTLKETTYVWDNAITGQGLSGKNLCKSADPSYDTSRGGIWSFNVPTTGAP